MQLKASAVRCYLVLSHPCQSPGLHSPLCTAPVCIRLQSVNQAAARLRFSLGSLHRFRGDVSYITYVQRGCIHQLSGSMSSFEKKRKPLKRPASNDSLSSYAFGDSYGFDLSSSSSSNSNSNSNSGSSNRDDVMRNETSIPSAATSERIEEELLREPGLQLENQAEHKTLQALLDQKNESNSLPIGEGNGGNEASKPFVILVVDDSAVHRKVSRKSLAHMSTEFNLQILVNTVENGERALEMHGSKDSIPDVMIIDEYMSSMGGRMLGHEVVATCRTRVEFGNCVIIGCTAKSDISCRKFMEAGCDAVWIKPMPKKVEALRQIMELVKQRKRPPQDRDKASSNDLLKEDLLKQTMDSQHKAAQPENPPRYSLFAEWSHVPKRFKHLQERSLEENDEPVLVTLEGMEILVCGGGSDTMSTISGSFI